MTPSRRHFLKTSSLALGAAALPRFSIGQPGGSPNSKLNIACIGVGGRGWTNIHHCLRSENIVALSDVDDARAAGTITQAVENGYPQLATTRLFKDYRELFAQMGDQIDAVVVSTPDHHHFPASMLAIQNGKHIFCEKPLTHTVGEARQLQEAARKHGVISQMGNQGHATEGIRLVKEWTDQGILGDVEKVVAWAPAHPDAFFKFPESYPVPPEEVPATLEWDLWLGPAEERPYSSYYVPKYWRGFWDFGNGTLGDWGCHTLDAPFWTLNLGAPTRVSAQTAQRNPYQPPAWAIVTWEFPARQGKPPVKLIWHTGNGLGELSHLPDWPAGKELADRGMAMIGSENTLLTDGRPDSPQLLSPKAMQALKQSPPPKTIPRVSGGPVREWLDAIKGSGPQPGSSFDYASPLTEMILLGCLAIRTGETIEWNSKKGRITNKPKLNQYIYKPYRNGWRF